MIEFKKASIEDVDKYIDIEKNAVGNYTYSGIITKEDAENEFAKCEIFFIYKDGELAGSCEYKMKSPDHAYMSGLVLYPKFRGKGIAHEAIKFRLEKLKDIKKIDVVTHPHNSKVISMYLAEGFFIESWIDNYYGDGQPRLRLVLNKK